MNRERNEYPVGIKELEDICKDVILDIDLFCREKGQKEWPYHGLKVLFDWEVEEFALTEERVIELITLFSAVIVEKFVFVLFLQKHGLYNLIDSWPSVIFLETLLELIDINLKHMLFIMFEVLNSMLIPLE